MSEQETGVESAHFEPEDAIPIGWICFFGQSHTFLLCRIKTLLGILQFFVVRKHSAFHLEPQGCCLWEEVCSWKMCAFRRLGEGKERNLSFCPSSHIPRDLRWESGQHPFPMCCLCCPEATEITFHFSCIRSCEGRRLWPNEVGILGRSLWNPCWSLGEKG